MNITNKHYKTYRMLALAFVVVLSLGVMMIALTSTSSATTPTTGGICSNNKTLTCSQNSDCGTGNTCYTPTGGGQILAGQVCMGDAFAKGLTCEANDIRIAATHNLVITKPCNFEGDTAIISFIAEFELTTQDRYDIGVWIAEDGGSAINGTCTVADFPIAPEPIPWTNLDTAYPTDTCGDITTTNNPVFSNIQNLTVACIDSNNDGLADVNACLSWSQDAKFVCTGPLQTIPGSPAKCLCQALPGLEIPVPPSLTLIKSVTNNNGGTAAPDDFKLTVGGASVLSGVKNTYLANTPLALNETQLTGYTFVSLTGDAKCPAALGGTVTLAVGDDITCTITNDDKSATLIVKKVVINDNGGLLKAENFTFSVNGGNAVAFEADGENDLTVNAGTYSVTEPAVTGYSTTYDNCTGLVIPNGGSATCTITNDDKPGTIVIKKITIPANSGSFDFITTGAGYNGFTLPGGGENTQTPLNAGTYTVQEVLQASWILTGIGGSTDPNHPYDCVVTGSGGSTGTGDLNTRTATINLKIGDIVTCTFENTAALGVTRTQGFWATHPQLAYAAWFGGSIFDHTFPGVAATAGIGDITLCGRPIDDLDKLMGGFWSNIAKTSTGAKRVALDRAHMQLLQQLLAAELNASAFGSVPSGGSGMFAAWESAYCGTNLDAIKTALGQAASFNEQGDTGAFTPGTSADSKTARLIANYQFWDVLP